MESTPRTGNKLVMVMALLSVGLLLTVFFAYRYVKEHGNNGSNALQAEAGLAIGGEGLHKLNTSSDFNGDGVAEEIWAVGVNGQKPTLKHFARLAIVQIIKKKPKLLLAVKDVSVEAGKEVLMQHEMADGGYSAEFVSADKRVLFALSKLDASGAPASDQIYFRWDKEKAAFQLMEDGVE